jgi:hypothetical protein
MFVSPVSFYIHLLYHSQYLTGIEKDRFFGNSRGESWRTKWSSASYFVIC